ncbi:MAG: twin-arginine translocase TatA/TatE family subunit [Ilumatobacter sp.]|jgi:sec-independent protein translocase protein TatA|uniref:twin-arginine translocase TatA/TatE family subunit n=1 Tax=Ilumatobacter sp. TaxID=1967498 RepID=UPI00391D4496
MLGGPEGIILIAVIVLLFGGSQIPKLARNLGLAQKELKDALKGDDEDAPAAPADQTRA